MTGAGELHTHPKAAGTPYPIAVHPPPFHSIAFSIIAIRNDPKCVVSCMEALKMSFWFSDRVTLQLCVPDRVPGSLVPCVCSFFHEMTVLLATYEKERRRDVNSLPQMLNPPNFIF